MADKTWTGRVLIKGEKKGVSSAFGAASKEVQGLGKSLKALGIAAGAAGVAKLFISTANTIKVFEKSMSELGAITGATGKDLDRLAEASRRIGQTTTLSASQAAEAFKLMASAKPDLLENLDALEATTLAAVTLSEAAGIELPQAATALGESLNQFGAGAEEAERFINVLAAGSQKGAALIGEMNLALKNSGVAASQAGLTFEQTNAALQSMAFAGVKGAEAGSKLRSVLVKLQVQSNDKFNPAVVGINNALKNLEEANLSVTERTKLFGEEALITADILIGSREQTEKLEQAITGTSTAQEQARTNTDNLDGSLKRLGSAFEAVQLSFSNTSGAMRIMVDGIADIFNALAAVNSPSEPGSISTASALMEGLALSLKTVFTAGVVLKNMFDTIIDVLGFVAKAIVRLLERDFGGIKDDFAELKTNLASEFEDVGEFAARAFDPELAAQVDANMRTFFMEPTVAVVKETSAAVAVAARTAGEVAAALAATKAGELAAKEAENEAKRIERLRLRNRTEIEVAAELFAEKLAQNIELLELEEITQLQFDERALENRRILHAKLSKLAAEAAKRDLTFAKMTSKQKTQTILSDAIALTQGVATSSKTLFKINKAAALAQAIVAMPAHISETMSKYPYPISIAMGALAAVSSLAQIQAIKSASFSGGGTGTTPSAAGSLPTINDIPVLGSPDGTGPLDVGTGQAGSALPNQDITIRIDGLDEGGLLSADQVRALMGSISDQLGDGVEIDTGG